jgi:pilus assembly protein Flp/PilA
MFSGTFRTSRLTLSWLLEGEMRVNSEMIRSLLAEEAGQDLVEYALVAGLIALGCVTVLQGLSGTIASVFSKAGTTMTSAS